MTQRFSFYERFDHRGKSGFHRAHLRRAAARPPLKKVFGTARHDRTPQNNSPVELSGGWKQAVALSACLIHERNCFCSTSRLAVLTRRRAAIFGTKFSSLPARD